MLVFGFWLMSLPYVNGDEEAVIENLSKIKNIWLNVETKPDPGRFFFVNVAYDQQLNTRIDADGFDQGKEAITDRSKLARFFNILNKKPDNQKFILCDIFFGEVASADEGTASISPDSLLAVELAKLKNLLLSTHLSQDDVVEKIVFNAPTAVADYKTTGPFLKFQLIWNDTIKTIPLRMYEMIHHTRAEYDGRFVKLGDARFLNNIIPDITIRQFNLFDDMSETRYKVDNLTNILSGAMTDEEVLESVKDRIIVIGDFENKDVHQTVYGDTAGSLILLNTYLALESGKNQVTFLFIVFLWLSFTGISYSIFLVDNPSEKLRMWLERRGWFTRIPVLLRATFFEVLNYPLMLLAVSVISFIFFDITISILYLMIWLFLVRQVVIFLNRPKNIR